MRMRLLKMAGIGFVLGMIAGNAIAWLTDGTIVNPVLVNALGSRAGSAAVQTLLSGLLGAVAMGGTLLYDLERWPLLLVSVCHYGMIEATYAAAALLLGWVRSGRELLVMMAVQLAAYLVIWVIMFLRYRAEVRKLNHLLEESREENRKENRKEKGEI